MVETLDRMGAPRTVAEVTDRDHEHDEPHGSTHEHAHGGGHDHAHSVRSFGTAFAVGIILNFGFVVAETVYGLLAHSMALVADAGHNLGDVVGLMASWGATLLARRRPTKRRTYGLRSTTIVASLGNALVLLFVTGGIAWESVRRILDPGAVAGKTVVVVALVGVTVNASSAALFMSGRKRDLNIRSAFVHLASDAVLALGVAVAGVVMMLTGWRLLDPIVSLSLSIVILVSTWRLLRASMNLILDAVPDAIDPDEVRGFLRGLPGVMTVHDLHIWAMSTTETAMTAHLVMTPDTCHPRFLTDAGKILHDRFKIEHSTLQVEAPESPEPCRLAPEETV